MKRLFLKLLLVSSPILTILGIYLFKDPFKVLYHYDSYFPKDGIEYVVLNKDYVSTETFLNNYPHYKYDSYIFGNSRTKFYTVDDWEKHINSNKCFHFDASGETVYGVERKFVFLHNRGVVIKNALIVFDQGLCRITQNYGEAHLFKKHPLLSGQSKLDFQIECLKAFFDVNFLGVYIPFLLRSDANKQAANKMFLNNEWEHYEVAKNEESYPDFEAMIARNRDSFFSPRLHVFYKRDTVQKYAVQTIKEEQIKLFNNIKKILDEDKTDYRLVISPVYDQVKFDTTDLKIIYSIFGKEHVFDFSGRNDITEDYHNYYEDSHYRPSVAARLMDSIYGKVNAQ